MTRANADSARDGPVRDRRRRYHRAGRSSSRRKRRVNTASEVGGSKGANLEGTAFDKLQILRRRGEGLRTAAPVTALKALSSPYETAGPPTAR